MKKLISLILISLFAISLAACGENGAASDTKAAESVTEASENNIVGGYTETESPKVTDEVKALVKKATDGLDGIEYTPVAYLATQVVAGTNHRILCKKINSTLDSVFTYALVTIYEDLQGNAELTDVIDSYKPLYPENYLSSIKIDWIENESLEIPDEAKAAFDKATETLTGAEYKPVALLYTVTATEGNNVVSYKKYKLLCVATPTVPDTLPYYVIVDVCSIPNIPGQAEITDTTEFISPDTAEEETSQDNASAVSTAE